jgi:putative endonuclease
MPKRYGTALAEPGGDPRQRLGRAGEAAAEAALSRAGLGILERRFRVRCGEIDLVALDGEVVVFVEVKTRSGGRYGGPAAAVTRRKRARIAKVAAAYLQSRRCAEQPCRFDVVEVFNESSGGMRVHHIVDAFRLWRTG